MHHETEETMDRILVAVFDSESKAYEGSKILRELDAEVASRPSRSPCSRKTRTET
jgi:hypothetical protein